MKIKISFILDLLALSLMPALIAGCSERKATRDYCPECEITAPLDSLFAGIFPAGQPGAIVEVMRGDSTVYSASFGVADFAKECDVDTSTMFNICSVSKQFVAVALVKLAAEGKLSLDDPISKYFPDFRAPFYQQITLRQMLSHTSGLPDIRPYTPAEWDEYAATHTTCFSRLRDFKLYSREDDALRMFENLDSLAFEPGTAYEYQNPTYQILAYVIEQASGEPFDPWMEENIFRPAGMTRTVFFSPAVRIPDMAHGYRPSPDTNEYANYRSPDGMWEEYDYGEADFFPTRADGGIFTTAGEFMNWQRALYGGRIIADSLVQMMHTPVIATDIPYTGYGLGFFIEQAPDKPRKVFHTGDNGGFHIYECAIPSRNISYLIFSNRNDWDREAAAAKVDSILAAHAWL